MFAQQHTQQHCMARLSSLGSQDADPEWLGGFTPSLHHHWFGFLSISHAPPLPDLLWYLPSSLVATPCPQPPPCLGVAVWISMLDVVEYEMEWERRGGQTVKREREPKQNTEYKAHPQQLFFLHQCLFLLYAQHTNTHIHSQPLH